MTAASIVWGFIFLGITFVVPPNHHLMYAVFSVIGIDFLTGVAKAKMNKVARTSEGYRKTVIKFLQYFVAIFVCYGAGKLIPDEKEILAQSAGFVMLFVIYIEVTSIFENLYEIDKKSQFSKYLIRPVLAILKFGIENNPVTKAADKIKENENQPVKP